MFRRQFLLLCGISLGKVRLHKIPSDEIMAQKLYDYMTKYNGYIQNMDDGEMQISYNNLEYLEITYSSKEIVLVCIFNDKTISLTKSSILSDIFYPETFPLSRLVNLRNIIIEEHCKDNYRWIENSQIGYYRNKK